MNTPKKLLVCSELGRASEKALRRAAMLCTVTGASAEVLYVIAHPVEDMIGSFGLDNQLWHESIRLAAMAALEKQVQRCWPQTLERPRLVLREGAVSQSICNYAEENGFDLVICGARSSSPWKKYFIGTTATRIVRTLTIPVLVVRRAADAAYAHALLPVDFSAYSARALEQTTALMPSARITLMHAFEAPFEGKMAFSGVDDRAIAHYVRKAREEAGRQLRSLAQASGLKQSRFSFMLRHGHAYREVAEAQHLGEFDCVTIGKHGRGFVTQLLLGSTTEHVLLESSTDVLVIPLPT